MRLLVLGGTRFLSRETARQAVARGHDVTCACRGESGPLPDGVTHVRWDRADDAPDAIRDQQWDAVVDVARLPSHVRRAVTATPGAHWVFVSTINVYDSTDTPGTPATLDLVEPVTDDVDLAQDPDAYGPMKVACEQIVTAEATSAAIVRPGLIVGPEDPTGRFSYWPARLAEDGAVLAPGSPGDTVQVIDVRDLAAWLVDLAEARTTGAYDGVGEVTTMASLLDRVAAGVGTQPSYTWVAQEVLEAQGVQPWMGEDAVPLWLPRPEYDGMMAHEPAPSLAAGLRLRPLTETAAATLAWLRQTPDAPVSGISREREAEVLAAVRGALARA
jgi:nucleoside-diphosphate-sugar epimerase